MHLKAFKCNLNAIFEASYPKGIRVQRENFDRLDSTSVDAGGYDCPMSILQTSGVTHVTHVLFLPTSDGVCNGNWSGEAFVAAW